MEQRVIEYIQSLAAKPANKDVLSPWYLIATCCLCSCNQGPLIVDVYRTAIALYPDDPASRRLVLRRMKEALLKTSIVFGLPRALHGFYPLFKAIPEEESQDHEVVRKDLKNPYDMKDRGEWYMARVLGKPAMDTMFETLEKNHSDLRRLVIDYIYGVLHSELSVLDAVTTSQITLASLLPIECMTEVAWHMRGLINNGGTMEDIDMALGIAKDICKLTGIEFKKEMPRPEEVWSKDDIVSSGIRGETT